MKTPIRFLFILVCSIGLGACGESHFLKDKLYREQVYEDLSRKKELLPVENLFAVLDESSLTLTEREALTFLYAYMPIGDIADYPGDYYLDNVRLTLQIRDEMPWGKDMPDDVFRHFVLPLRVNNENLDDARGVFYAELKERVEGLSMEDAILEVNHWCHEKVIYTPSDARTSSPLATVKTAYGRCGEESTFTVAALRSVGIPARQVYTPRWAHTDDNHAWVEAWANGKWHFMGACEPEPVLDLGWFNAPASRGMLMHTKVFGRYNGSEEIMLETPNYTEINVIGNYAPTTKAVVRVVNKDGNPVSDARVEFKVYNYAEFYTVATKHTQQEGTASLTAGKGDMLVWASKDGRFGYSKLTFGKDSTLDIILDKAEGEVYSLQMDITPPVESSTQPAVTPEQRAENDRRLAQEDSIRNIYVATFMNEEQADALVDRLIQSNNSVALEPLDAVKIRRPGITHKLVASRGNHQTLVDFLSKASEKGELKNALRLLDALSAKDLRDVSLEVLNDQLIYVSKGYITKLYSGGDFNPRIANEMLTPYRSFFREAISVEDAKRYFRNPQALVEWCKMNIVIRNELNSQRIPITPIGVWKARAADELSRNIFFVAIARSVGISAWIDEVTGKVQYMSPNDSQDIDSVDKDDKVSFRSESEDRILDVDFDASEPTVAHLGTIRMTYRALPYLDDPKYYTHFTLSRFENGNPRLLSFEEEMFGRPTSWAFFRLPICKVDTGYYMLTTGTRLAKGNVLCNISFFNVKEKEETVVDLVMRESKDEIRVIGNFNSESTFRLADSGNVQSVLQANGRGYYVVGVVGVGQEPTNHALRDLAVVAKNLEKWGKKLILLFPDEAQYRRYNASEFPGLPSTIIYGIDTDGAIQKQIVQEMKLSNPSSLPIFIIGDTFNRVVFVSQGYTIGLGEQLMKVINRL